MWAKTQDPFDQIWIKVQTANHGRTKGVVVLPKNVARPIPVVVYLHGSSGSLLRSGNDLRQMAEMGLAVVGIEYSQTNSVVFESQFAALQVWLKNQKWADTNKVAWVGLSLGAQRQLSFIFTHPKSQPNLLVRVAGGWVSELEQNELPASNSDDSRAGVQFPTSNLISPSTLNMKRPTVLLLHGEQDNVFPIADTRRVAEVLRTKGFRVEFKSFPGQLHNFDSNHAALFRGIGEYCLKYFNESKAFEAYESILAWQARAKSLWFFWTPALAWLVVWYCINRCIFSAPVPSDKKQSLAKSGDDKVDIGRLSRLEIGLRWSAGILAAVALAQTALHLIPPHLAVTDRTLDVARKHLVQQTEKNDFDALASNPAWRGKRLRSLLAHVELANYNRQLINWKLDDDIYREFVLSALVTAAFDGEMNWRRPLWESFYPRIRKENRPERAAEIIVGHLRGRITIIENFDSPKTISEIWHQQITNEQGFEAIYVAALRSAGVAARLNEQGKAEFWNSEEWKTAPAPMVKAIQ